MKNKEMKRISDIGQYQVGDWVIESIGIVPIKALVMKIELKENYATIYYKWHKDADTYHASQFLKSKNIIDFGFWNEIGHNVYPDTLFC